MLDERCHGLGHLCLERVALDGELDSDESGDPAGCGAGTVDNHLAFDRSAARLDPKTARRLLDSEDVDTNREVRAVRLRRTRESRRREKRVRLTLTRHQQPANHPGRDVRSGVKDVLAREQL